MDPVGKLDSYLPGYFIAAAEDRAAPELQMFHRSSTKHAPTDVAQSTRLRFTSDFQLLATAQEAASIATNYVTAILMAPHEILPGFTSPPVRKELFSAKYFLEEEATPKQRGCQSVTDGILFVSQLSGNKKSKLVACNREENGPNLPPVASVCASAAG